MQAKGLLKKISAKSGTSKHGPWTAYSFLLEENGEEVWYRYGFEAPTVTEGSVVMFSYNEDGKGNKKVDGDVKVDKTASRKAAVKGSSRDDSIVRQNACTHATKVAHDLVSLGLVSMPKTKNKGYDAYLELIDELTDRFFIANRNAKSVEELAEDAVSEDVDEDAAFDEDDDDVWKPV